MISDILNVGKTMSLLLDSFAQIAFVFILEYVIQCSLHSSISNMKMEAEFHCVIYSYYLIFHIT